VTPIGGGSQVTTAFVHDAFGQLAAEYNTAAVTPACTTCYLTYDMLGSVRMVTDQNQAVIARHDYLPFGEELPNGTAGRSGNGFDAVSNVTHGFTGQESDGGTAFLDFFNARHLSAPVGAFIQPDPMNAGADITRPQSWNAYGYVLGNPLGLVDPSGMCSASDSTPCYSGGTTVIGATSNDPDFASSTDAYNLLNSILTNAYQFLTGGGGSGGGANFAATGYGKADVDTMSTAAFSMLLAPAKNGITSAQLQIILNAAKKDAGSCASTFSAGMIPYRLKFSLKAFDAQIQNAKYLQYPNPATSPLGPLSSVEAQALKGSIALYPNFFTDTSARQAGIVVHENLHTYTGWNDANVFYAFQQRGITPNEIKLFTSYGNTDGITTWILRGCK
jgi:RHS repeat-associated protein